MTWEERVSDFTSLRCPVVCCTGVWSKVVQVSGMSIKIKWLKRKTKYEITHTHTYTYVPLADMLRDKIGLLNLIR